MAVEYKPKVPKRAVTSTVIRNTMVTDRTVGVERSLSTIEPERSTRTFSRSTYLIAVLLISTIGSLSYAVSERSDSDATSSRNKSLEITVAEQARDIDRLNKILKSITQEERPIMNKDEQSSGKAAIFIAPGSKVGELKVTGSRSIGAPMLVSESATIDTLTMSLNKVYGADHAVRLGDVFSANIDKLYFETHLQRNALKEIVDAGASSDTKASLKERMKKMISDPAQLSAYYTLAEKIWQAGKPLISF